MKQFLDRIWNMPGNEFAGLLFSLSLLIFVAFCAFVLFRAWSFKQFERKVEARREEFRKREGI